MFTKEELDASLGASRRSSSPGPNGITYAALAHLGQEARQELFNYYWGSWHDGIVRQQWKISRLVPLIKPIESHFDLTLYRLGGLG